MSYESNKSFGQYYTLSYLKYFRDIHGLPYLLLSPSSSQFLAENIN